MGFDLGPEVAFEREIFWASFLDDGCRGDGGGEGGSDCEARNGGGSGSGGGDICGKGPVDVIFVVGACVEDGDAMG